MPHFTLEIATGGGPILNAIVTPSAPRVLALRAASQAVPTPIPIRALVDTGASCTCIDPSILQQLQLESKGSVPMHTASSGSQSVDLPQYDVGLHIPASPNQAALSFATIPVVATELAVQGIHALIGRDILKSCIFSYNGSLGPNGHFTIAY